MCDKHGVDDTLGAREVNDTNQWKLQYSLPALHLEWEVVFKKHQDDGEVRKRVSRDDNKTKVKVVKSRP